MHSKRALSGAIPTIAGSEYNYTSQLPTVAPAPRRPTLNTMEKRGQRDGNLPSALSPRTLLEARRLALELAQVVELRPPHLVPLHNFDLLDDGCV